MLTFNAVFDANTYLFTYMFIYNLSLTVLFWTLLSVIVTEIKNMYSLANFSYNSYFVFILTVLLLSMAGVPPFIGFFSKLFIITLLMSSAFFLLYSLLFIVLFIGLYFYIQNIRFLHTTNPLTLNTPQVSQERVVPVYYYTSLYLALLLVLGLWYIDDFLLVFVWLFN